jgi:hypothetical protein
MVLRITCNRARATCVNLGRGQVRVAEQHLHGAQIGAVIEQMRRKRVP